MSEPPAQTAPDEPMREGMEGLIAAMKGRKPAARGSDIGSDSTVLQGDDRDSLADAPWAAVALDGTPLAPVLERGAIVGRYVVLQQLGAGGMGVVHAAYDPELDRKLALKLLLPGAAGPSARTRLLREAQALAKLSHPNVVAIHDVGTVGEQVWLAMELVQGQTLGHWLRSPRRWQEVLAVMLEAGRGLAAAHAVPLLHRDFKPDNVMVGDDGRVRVMDFGLARGRSRTTHEGDGATEPTVDTLGMQVTRAGTIVGTPRYMAPEQFDGTELTTAADQFAFCVTLWEALYGERPFGGSSWSEIVAHVLGGKLRPPPKGRRVPVWLRRACERGLAADPEQRWPSMPALLETLAKGRTRARVRTGLAMFGVLVLLGAGVEGNRRYDLAQRTAACEATGDEIATAWNPEREHTLRAAFSSVEASYAATTADKAIPWLDRQTRMWREARVEACLDADVRGTWDADMHDRSLWCLDERRTELESLVDELTRADRQVLDKAVTAAAGLASVAACRNERALVTLDPPPPETREAIRAVRADVTRANNLERAGRYDQGLALAQAAVERAEALEWPPLAGAAKLERGALLDRVGRYAEAETALEDAYFAAGGGAAPDVAVDAAIELVRLVGIQLERIDDARRWGRHAEAALAAIDDGEGLSRASLRANLGFVDSIAGDQEQAMRLLEQALATRARTQGDGHPAVIAVLHELALVHQTMADFDQALALEQRVLDLATQALGPDHPNVAATLNALAAFHVQRGDYAKAQAMLEQTLAARERVLGTEHPELANLLDNLAIIHYTVGDYEKARLLFERSLALTEKAAGPQSPSVSGTLANLAQLHYMIEDYEQAKALFERALAIREKALGPEHATVAAILDGLGDVYWYTGAQDEAAVLYERASTIHEKALGPDHPDLAGSLSRLARARRRTGAYDEARALYTRVLAIYERALGLDHPTTAHALLGIAELELEQHRPAEALPLAQRALAMFEKHGVEPYNTAMARFRLAQALWDLPADGGRDRPRAMQLVEQARDRFRAIGQGGTEGLSVVDAWLAAHREEGRGRSTDRPPLPERPRR